MSAALPLLVGAHAVLARLNFGAERSGREAAAGADGVAAEAVGALPTVAAFNMQSEYVALYRARLAASTSNRTAFTSGLGFGFSQFTLMAISALAFWYGGTQVATGRIDFRQLLTAFFAVFYAAFGVAQASRGVAEGLGIGTGGGRRGGGDPDWSGDIGERCKRWTTAAAGKQHDPGPLLLLDKVRCMPSSLLAHLEGGSCSL